MVPSSEVLQAAVKAAHAKNPSNTHISVMEVNQFIPRDQGYVIRRMTIVEDAIKAVFPQAKDIGGGVFQIKK